MYLLEKYTIMKVDKVPDKDLQAIDQAREENNV